MWKLTLALLFSLCNAFAQGISSSSNSSNTAISSTSEPACAIEAIPGMRYSRYVHNVNEKYFFNKSINVHGVVVNTSETEAFVLDSFRVEPKSKIVQLKNVSVQAEHPYDSVMVLAFDSNTVFVPFDFDVQVGDTVYIEKYSTLFFALCNETGSFMNKPVGHVSGTYSNVLSQPLNLVRQNEAHQKNYHGKRGRDASGKFLKSAPSKIIKY